MFIFWGTKKIEKKLGWVADFCFGCGSIKAFHLEKHAFKSHIYYLPYGKEKNIEHRISCADCKVDSVSDIEKYNSIVKTKKLNMFENELMTQTFPNIESVYKDRFALERSIKKGPSAFNNETWEALIKEPFEVYEHKLNSYLSQTQIDRQALVSLALLVCIPLMTVKLLEYFSLAVELKTNLIIGSFLLCLPLVIIQFRGVAKRYTVKELYPKLANSLKRFSGNEAEIQRIFNELNVNKFRLTQKGSYEKLETLIKN